MGTSIPRVARLALSILFTLAAGAGADEIIYDNGAATAEGGSAASDFDFPSQVTDDFILFPGLPTRVGRIDWWGQYVNNNTPTAPDDFTIRVFNDSPEGTPLSVPFVERRVGHVGRSNTGPFSHGFDTYAYSASFEPIILAPDTWYWLSIVNDTSGDANDDWFWSRHLKSQGNFFIRAADGSTWNGPIPSTLAFQLYTPEPAAGMTLWFASALMLALRPRRSSVPRLVLQPCGSNEDTVGVPTVAHGNAVHLAEPD